MNPKVSPQRKSRGAGISLPPDIILRAKKQAKRSRMSLSGFVRQLLLKELQEIEK